MSNKYVKLVRKPFYVSAVQVTPENMSDLALECEGDVRKDHQGDYIKVHVRHPLNARQTKAYAGDWLLFADNGHKVYTDKALWRNFDEVQQVDPFEQHKNGEEEVWVDSSGRV